MSIYRTVEELDRDLAERGVFITLPISKFRNLVDENNKLKEDKPVVIKYEYIYGSGFDLVRKEYDIKKESDLSQEIRTYIESQHKKVKDIKQFHKEKERKNDDNFDKFKKKSFLSKIFLLLTKKI